MKQSLRHLAIYSRRMSIRDKIAIVRQQIMYVYNIHHILAYNILVAVNAIITKCLASFEAQSGFSLTVMDEDCMVLTTGSERYLLSYRAIKSVTVPRTTDMIEVDNPPSILVAQYISGPAKTHLRERNINYLDAAGNAFLQLPDRLLIFVETGKSSRPSPPIKGRAFTPAGLRVVFQFLTWDTINLPYREIGQLAGVSIDTVGKTVKDLLTSSFLIEIESRMYELNRREELIEDWVAAFNRVLRPKLKSAHFAFGHGTNPRDLVETSPPDSLSGELAADILGTDLIGDRATIYTDRPFHSLAKDLGLVPAGEEGSVEIVQRFWKGTEDSDHRTVPPLLVYADLRNRPNPRNLAAARKLYEDYVRPAL
jgi:hypothetical protein